LLVSFTGVEEKVDLYRQLIPYAWLVDEVFKVNNNKLLQNEQVRNSLQNVRRKLERLVGPSFSWGKDFPVEVAALAGIGQAVNDLVALAKSTSEVSLGDQDIEVPKRKAESIEKRSEKK